MNHKEKSFNFDRVLIAGAVLTFSAAVFFLLGDDYFSNNGNTKDLKPVGSVKESQNDVRRRVNNGLTWMPVGKKDQIYEGDSIFTGEKSGADIALDNGGSLNVDPNSLIVVKTSDNEVQIDLKYGSLVGQIASDKKIIITDNGKTVQEISGGKPGKRSQLRITKSKQSKEASIQVLSGEVGIKQAGQSAVKKIKSAPIQLLAPETAAVFWNADTEGTSFKWTSEAKDTRFVIEFSTDESFTKIVTKKETSAQEVSLIDLQKTPGLYQWRVRQISADPKSSVVSPSRSVSIFPNIAPQLIEPRAEQTFVLPVQRGDQAVALSWSDKAGSLDYQVQVSLDVDFKNPVLDQKVALLTTTTKPLLPGTYYWHVQGLHPKRQKSPWSATRRFRIQEIPKLTAPELVKNSINYQLPKALVEVNKTNLEKEKTGVAPADMPLMTWKPVDQANLYQLEVADNEGLNAAVTEEILAPTTSFRFAKVKPGPLYWRVRTVNKNNVPGAFNSHVRWTVELPPPTILNEPTITQDFTDKAEFDKAQAKIKLEWTPWVFAAAYEIQFSDDMTFNKLKTGRLKESFKDLTFTRPASYYWRVRALNNSGTPISPFSEMQHLEYIKNLAEPVLAKQEEPPPQPTPSPTPRQISNKGFRVLPNQRNLASAPEKELGVGAPSLREPKQNTKVISFGKTGVFLTFKWSQVAQAKTYEIQLASTADFAEPFAATKTKETQILMEENIPEGPVYWRVRGQLLDGYSKWSSPNQINIVFQKGRVPAAAQAK